MKTSRFKVRISLLLALCMAFMASAPVLAVNTEESKRAAFDALPDNTIVCYMYGQPVYKYEVNENGYVDKDFGNLPQTRSSAGNGTLPSAHRGETISASVTLVTTGFSQTENILYAPCEYAYEAIEIIRTNGDYTEAAIKFCGLLTGNSFSRGISNLFAILVSLGTNDLCNQVEENYKNGDDSQIEIVTSQYGQFYNVSPWNGTSVAKTGYSDATTTITVNSVVCQHGSVWD